MPETVSKDKTRLRVLEWEVRDIDEHGDAVDVRPHDTRKEAQADFDQSQALAVVLERVVKKYPAHLHSDPNVFELVMSKGDNKALYRWATGLDEPAKGTI